MAGQKNLRLFRQNAYLSLNAQLEMTKELYFLRYVEFKILLFLFPPQFQPIRISNMLTWALFFHAQDVLWLEIF
jgi:hypothetical protein